MVGQVGAGIDHRHLAGADDIGLRAGIGERRGIGGEQAAHARRSLLRTTIGRIVHGRAMRRARRRGQGPPMREWNLRTSSGAGLRLLSAATSPGARRGRERWSRLRSTAMPTLIRGSPSMNATSGFSSVTGPTCTVPLIRAVKTWSSWPPPPTRAGLPAAAAPRAAARPRARAAATDRGWSRCRDAHRSAGRRSRR